MGKAHIDRCSLGKVAFQQPICAVHCAREPVNLAQSGPSPYGAEGPMHRLTLFGYGSGGNEQRARVQA